jgi:sugar lactone lactonase YvrE
VSIEVGPNGNIYVGDAVNNRLDQFASDGTFIRGWGWGVDTGASAFEKCTTASGCQGGSQNGGAGELQSPDGIAAAGNGDLFVTEFSDNRVSQFTADGDFVRAWGWGVDTGASAFEICTAGSGCQTGVSGNGLGQLQSPNSVAVTGNDVYVTETSNHRVSRFTTAGVPVSTFGSFGSGAGQLSGPRGVAIAPGGNVLVMDTANNRVSEFTPTGVFVRARGFGVDTGASSFETCTTGSGCQAGIPGGAAGQLSDGDAGEGASGIAVDAQGNIYVADDGNGRIAQYAPNLAFTRAWGFDVAPPDDAVNVFEECTTVTGCQQGAADNGPGGLGNPADINVDALGGVLVVDYQIDRVVRYADPPPPTPAIDSTDPGSPSSDNEPEVRGSAAADLTVRIYATADCTGPPLATGSAALFSSSQGITTPVPSDATTDLRATAAEANGNTSACSAAFPYTEDSTAPMAPTLSGTDPPSGADQNKPKVRGSAEAGSEVVVYPSANCSGQPTGIGTPAELASSGIEVSVSDDSTTPLSALARDAAENVSTCSAPISYAEVSRGVEDEACTKAKQKLKKAKKKLKKARESGKTNRIKKAKAKVKKAKKRVAEACD